MFQLACGVKSTVGKLADCTFVTVAVVAPVVLNVYAPFASNARSEMK